MTIKKIIEKLKKKSEQQFSKGRTANGIYNVLIKWYEEMQDCEQTDKLDEYYNKIYGILYGLHGTYFITEKELENTVDELLEIYKITLKKTN